MLTSTKFLLFAKLPNHPRHLRIAKNSVGVARRIVVQFGEGSLTSFEMTNSLQLSFRAYARNLSRFVLMLVGGELITTARRESLRARSYRGIRRFMNETISQSRCCIPRRPASIISFAAVSLLYLLSVVGAEETRVVAAYSSINSGT
jgi:hypothetical protein